MRNISEKYWWISFVSKILWKGLNGYDRKACSDYVYEKLVFKINFEMPLYFELWIIFLGSKYKIL